MRQTDKSLQSEKFKQVVGGLGKPLGKIPAPDRIQSPRDLDRSFPCWPGSEYFGTAPGGVLSTAEGPRPCQPGHPRRLQTASYARGKEMCGAASTTLRFYRLAIGYNFGSMNAFRLFFGASARSR